MRVAPALLLLVLLAPVASAHATLQSAEPAPNSHADVGVDLVVIRFTEDVEKEYSGADIVDTKGDSWAAGPAELDPSASNVLRLPVKPLPDGIYSVSWRALSVDTHTTRGAFLFAVGNATLSYHPPVAAQDPVHEGVARDGFARAVFYGGLMLALGLPLFGLLVVRDPLLPRSLLATAATAAALGAVGAFVGFLFLADRTDLSLAAVLSTGPGAALAWRGGLLALSAVAAVLAFRSEGSRQGLAIVAAGLAAAALLATSLGSHAAAARDARGLLIASDALHLGMAALWIGGVVGFLHVAWGRAPQELGRMVLRFSPLAVASVALILATGTYASIRHIPCATDFSRGLPCAGDLRQESYIRLVALKIALMLPLIAIGAYNKLRAGPMLEAGRDGLRAFRRLVQAEAIVMAMILSAAGILAATSPPDVAVQDVGTYAPAALELQNFTSKSHVIVQITPNPVTVGLQEIVVQVHPLGGKLPNATLVQIKVAGPGEPEPETTISLEKTAPGEWSGKDAYFTSAGTWKLTVLVDRGDEFARMSFDVPVANPGGA